MPKIIGFVSMLVMGASLLFGGFTRDLSVYIALWGIWFLILARMTQMTDQHHEMLDYLKKAAKTAAEDAD